MSTFTKKTSMSINKHQFERLSIIHSLLQKGGKYSVEELVEALIKKLTTLKDASGDIINVSRRTLISDIKYLRHKNAPIPLNSKKYYYSEPYSFLEILGKNDAEFLDELKGIVQKLQIFNKISQLMNVNFDEIALKISDPTAKIVLFDNPLENLGNSEMLPAILNYIQNKIVLFIKYRDFQNQTFEDVFHPYVLKEYNGRWYIFGLSENKYLETGKKQIFQYPIDRIREITAIQKPKISYLENTDWNVDQHFQDMVGVTKLDGEKKIIVVVRVFGSSVDYLLTKRIHHSQEIVLEEEEYSDFTYNLINNYEFRSKILALGSNAEVLEPKVLREYFKGITTKMQERYLE